VSSRSTLTCLGKRAAGRCGSATSMPSFRLSGTTWPTYAAFGVADVCGMRRELPQKCHIGNDARGGISLGTGRGQARYGGSVTVKTAPRFVPE
jgi:hypothetical protein